MRALSASGNNKCSQLQNYSNASLRSQAAKAAQAALKVQDMFPPEHVQNLQISAQATEKAAGLLGDEPSDNVKTISYPIVVDGKTYESSKKYFAPEKTSLSAVTP